MRLKELLTVLKQKSCWKCYSQCEWGVNYTGFPPRPSVYFWTARSGVYELEHATPLHSCHVVFIDRFIFRSNLLWMRLPWECHNQSHDTNWRHCVTGPELPFFHKRKGVLKIDQSVKMPWHRLRMGVGSSCSPAPDSTYWSNYGISCFIFSPTVYILSILSKHLSRRFCVM